MYILFVTLAVVTAILLALVVLIQESKGGGLASNVSGANSVLGVRKTKDFIEKATWGLAAALVVFSVATSFFARQDAEDPADLINKMSAPAPVAPTTPASTTPAQAPAGQAAPAQTPAAPAAPAAK